MFGFQQLTSICYCINVILFIEFSSNFIDIAIIIIIIAARGSVVGLGTMLQAGSSLV
jgi:hypothetical protein